LQIRGIGIVYVTLSERIPAVNEHKGSVGGLRTEIAVGKTLSGIGFPCWLEKQESDP